MQKTMNITERTQLTHPEEGEVIAKILELILTPGKNTANLEQEGTGIADAKDDWHNAAVFT